MSSTISAVISNFSPEEAPKPGRVCSVSGKTFERGDVVYSFLCEESDEIKRYDICADAKRDFTPPGMLLAQWKAKVGANSEKAQRAKLAPNDALTSLFVSLADKPEKAALRYALALLLTRRRVFRFEMEENARVAKDHAANQNQQNDVIYVYSPREETGYVVPVVVMDAQKAGEVQAKLLELLESPVAQGQTEGSSLDKTTDNTSEVQSTLGAFDSQEVADAAEAAFKALEDE